jgi:hypothetical protein
MPTTTPDAGVAAAARLARFVAAHEAGEQPPADDTQWLAAALARYLREAAAGIDVDAVLGLAVPPGGTPWWRAAATAERDALIRTLAANIPGRTYAKAIAVRQRLERYAASSWLRDRISKQPTPNNVVLFEIYNLDPHPPTSISRLRGILSQ